MVALLRCPRSSASEVLHLTLRGGRSVMKRRDEPQLNLYCDLAPGNRFELSGRVNGSNAVRFGNFG